MDEKANLFMFKDVFLSSIDVLIAQIFETWQIVLISCYSLGLFLNLISI